MVKADWKRLNFRWRLKVDRVSIERMCAGREFQVKGADAEKAREEKLLVIPAGLIRRLFCIGRTQGSGWKIVRNEFREVERLEGMKCCFFTCFVE